LSFQKAPRKRNNRVGKIQDILSALEVELEKRIPQGRMTEDPEIPKG